MSEGFDEAVARLTVAEAKAAAQLGEGEVRYLVDLYYQLQEMRKGTANQTRALVADEQPFDANAWVAAQFETMERQIRRVLARYADSVPLGEAVQRVVGIGPVITAGLLAHVDIAKAPTVGHIWRFAGLDPTCAWGKGEKRPWNARLKVLCWKIGESFVKVMNHPEAEYGPLLKERKAYEWQRNLSGGNAEAIAARLADRRPGRDTEAIKWLTGQYHSEDVSAALAAGELSEVKPREGGTPMLPPGQIHARAKRWTVKLFLSDYHLAAYRLVLGQEPPLSYALTLPEHAHRWIASWVPTLK